MQINVYEMIEADKFFIGSYPDNFSKGRWFTVEELIYSSYEKIEAEYLDKYNPNGQSELELGVFDIENVSGLWSGGFCCKVFQKIYFSVKLRKKTERTE